MNLLPNRFAALALLRTCCAVALLFCISIGSGWAQSISGVINTYHRVTNITGNQVTVVVGAGLAVNDRVLLIQMKGATITQTNNAAYGDVTAYNDAGNYEVRTVTAVAGNVITLDVVPCNTYTPATGFVQLVRIPVHPNPTVTATLMGATWNGALGLGGVIAVETPGTLTLNADIDASSIGFRGGNFQSGGFSCADAVYFSNLNQGGEKGEGITDWIAGQNCSRGKLANGGGGANRGNSGGGGGANGGAGGMGGRIYSGCGNSTIQGLGGQALVQTSNKLFLGGGGGGGFRDNGQTVAAGAPGGGIILIIANTIAGNNNNIRSNGGTVFTVTNDEGAGGGGGGGSVNLFVQNYSSTTNVITNGGDGGNTFNNIFTTNCHGPGGGGGGGNLWILQGALPPNLTHTANAGSAGIVANPSQPCFNTTFQGTNGQAGTTNFNLSPAGSISLNLGPNVAFCAGGSTTLDAGPGFLTYAWNTGANTQTINVSTPGQYHVTVTSSCGIAADTIQVTVNPLPTPTLGNDTSICADANLNLTPGAYTTYAWNTGAGTPNIVVNTAGQYQVTVTDANGCQGADTINVGINALPTPNIGPDQAICAGNNVTLNAGVYNAWAWNTGPITQTITVGATGQYQVTVTDGNGCQGADTMNLTVNPLPVVNLGPDQAVCQGQTFTFNAGAGFSAYAWSNGANSQTITVGTGGSYSVTVTDGNGCQNADTVVLTVNANPVISLGPDVAICQNQTQVFTPGGGFVTYGWNTGAGTQSITVGTAGQYQVTVTDANGCVGADTVNLVVNPLPTPSLGPDFLLCTGTSVTIGPSGGPYSSYQWHNGSPSPTFPVTAAGQYAVTVTDANGCQAADTVNVTEVSASVDIGNDTSICVGGVATFDAGAGYTSYAWSTGANTQTITATTAGAYTVTVTDVNGCVATDVVLITAVVPFPVIDIGPDTVLCANASLLLNPGPGYDDYLWSTGSTGQTQQVIPAVGTYSVTVTNDPGCSGTASMSVTGIIPLPTVNVLQPQQFCDGDSTTFDAGPGWNGFYQWNTGATTQTITVDSPGTYEVTIANQCASVSSSAEVLPLLFPPQPVLGNDTFICEDPVVLDAGPLYNNYLWSNGYDGRLNEVFEPGWYTVTTTNQCGSGSDSLLVILDCPPVLYVPTAFTPNGDGLNDEFGPTGDGVEGYSMQIFDRWGKLIFQTRDQNQLWDGTLGSAKVPEGVYVYRILYSYSSQGEQKDIKLSGSITLVR